MIRKILVIAFCCVMLTGCAQSMKQHRNTIDAINKKLTLINYNKTFIFRTFGYPDSKTSSSSDGVRVEKWTYKTNLGDKDLLFNAHPYKTRYLKVTFGNDIVTDVTIE